MTYPAKHVTEILAQVVDELSAAVEKFPSFNSAHEGYAIILEELEELWGEIMHNKIQGSNARQREEAIQVAAMAIRFVLDISDQNKPSNEREKRGALDKSPWAQPQTIDSLPVISHEDRGPGYFNHP